MAHSTSPAVSPRVAARFARQVVQQLQDEGFVAYWAGGCVRDQVMGREPKDFDVATSATPDQVRGLFGQRRTLPLGAAFGVVAVLGPRAAGLIEVATFRRDSVYSDGRRPDNVCFSTPEEDARRRDFTINGLFFDPVSQQILDYVNGQTDISREVIRCIGDPGQRIDEDKLRMLRAVRFATVLGFHIDDDTKQAIIDHATEIERVSAERIGGEMRQILAHPDRIKGLELLRATGLARAVLPAYELSSDTQESSQWQMMMAIMRHLPTTSTQSLVMAALLWPICAPTTMPSVVDELTERWRLTNVENRSVNWLLRHVETVRNGQRVAWPTLQRVLIEPLADELNELAGAIELSVNSADADLAGCKFAAERLQWPTDRLNPPALINGHDLKQLPIAPGPKMGEWLERVRDAQLNGQLRSRDEAIAWIREQLNSP